MRLCLPKYIIPLSGHGWNLRGCVVGVNVNVVNVVGGRGCVVCWFAGLCGRGMRGNGLDWLAGRSFFDHMVLAASGDG